MDTHGEKMQESVFTVRDLCCPSEEQIIRDSLDSVSGIDEVIFNLMEKKLTVRHSRDDSVILSKLKGLNMGVEQEGAEGNEFPDTSKTPFIAKIMLLVSGLAAISAEVYAWTTSDEQAWPVIALALLSITTGGKETFKKGLAAIRSLTFNINALMMIAITGAVLIGEWPEAAMVVFLFALAELIETHSLDNARNAIRGLMEMSPETATIRQENGSWCVVNAEKVEIGQTVKVKPGERVPLDGEIINGSSTVNQAPITGESMPVEKKQSDEVFAGTINERGTFEFRVTSGKEHTTLARIIRTVQEAQSQRAPTQRFIDRFAEYYTPAVVLLAVLIAIVPPLLAGQEFQPWFYKALVVLVISCPCALVISTPVTVVSGLAAAARSGMLIKGGVYLEEGRRLKALALDKTGTLTVGRPKVTDVHLLGDVSETECLKLAASLETHSEHPIAAAIVTHAGIDQREYYDTEAFEAMTGRGIRASIEGAVYYIGNHRLIEELGICRPELEDVLESLEKEGKTVVILAGESAPLCVFAVADTIRDSSVKAIRKLQGLGVHCVVLTGDNQITADAIGKLVGLEDVRGNMLPDDKLQAIEDLRRDYGVTGMVGDGVNDAPALARASIGFAMGTAGTDTALETADVALMEDDLHRLPDFIELSRKTGYVLKQNIALAIGIKVVFLALTLIGQTTLWMAVFADVGASIIVIFNGLRLLKKATYTEM